MILSEKERTTIEDLQTQEKSCIEKYGKERENVIIQRRIKYEIYVCI